MPTYLKDTYIYQLQTKIAEVNESKVVFEDTVFHPQGGGQPNDKGFMVVNGHKYEITAAAADKETGKVSSNLI